MKTPTKATLTDEIVLMSAGPNCNATRAFTHDEGIRLVISKNNALTTKKLIDEIVILKVRHFRNVREAATL